jgi:hypothetical protein
MAWGPPGPGGSSSCGQPGRIIYIPAPPLPVEPPSPSLHSASSTSSRSSASHNGRNTVSFGTGFSISKPKTSLFTVTAHVLRDEFMTTYELKDLQSDKTIPIVRFFFYQWMWMFRNLARITAWFLRKWIRKETKCAGYIFEDNSKSNTGETGLVASVVRYERESWLQQPVCLLMSKTGHEITVKACKFGPHGNFGPLFQKGWLSSKRVLQKNEENICWRL